MLDSSEYAVCYYTRQRVRNATFKRLSHRLLDYAVERLQPRQSFWIRSDIAAALAITQELQRA